MDRNESRALLTVAAVLAASVALLRVAWLPGIGLSELPHALATTTPDRSLPLLLALALVAFAAWLAATVLAALVAGAPGAAGRWGRAALQRLAPATVRRTLAVTLGLTVLTGTPAVAQAAGPISPVTVTQTSRTPALSLDWPTATTASPVHDLDRPAPAVHHDPGRGLSIVTTVPRTAPRTPAAQAVSPPTVTVQPGDSLWRIAARALPRGASTAAVERSWHRWYTANRTVIGPDPGLLQPGQHLTPPPS